MREIGLSAHYGHCIHGLNTGPSKTPYWTIGRSPTSDLTTSWAMIHRGLSPKEKKRWIPKVVVTKCNQIGPTTNHVPYKNKCFFPSQNGSWYEQNIYILLSSLKVTVRIVGYRGGGVVNCVAQ
jgi:hypothetical protein